MSKNSKISVEYRSILVATIILSLFGLLMVLSASFVVQLEMGNSIWGQAWKQLLAFAVGFAILFLVSRMPLKRIFQISVVSLAIVDILIAFVFLFGDSIGGNKNWIIIANFSFQPSEFAKPLFVVVFATILAEKYDQYGEVRNPIRAFRFLPSQNERMRIRQNYPQGVQLSVWLKLFWSHHDSKMLAILFACLIGIGIQGDLGTLITYALVIFSLLWISGISKRMFTTLSLLAIIFATIMTVLSTNRRSRFAVALFGCSPTQQSAGLCDQRDHAISALATGGLLGVGPGASREKWGRLPAAHNDMIFAVVGEEFGFIGAVLVIFAFLFLTVMMLRSVSKQASMQRRLIGTGITVWISGQAMLNIIVVTFPFAPVIGVTLPFISYGGSSVIATMVGMGIILATCRTKAQLNTPSSAIKSAVNKRRAGKVQIVASPRR